VERAGEPPGLTTVTFLEDHTAVSTGIDEGPEATLFVAGA